HRGGLDRRADSKSEALAPVLSIRKVQMGSRFLLQRIVFYCVHQANNGHPGLILFGPSKAEAFANGRFAGPMAPRQGLIDNRYQLATLLITLDERSACENSNTHRFEISWGNMANSG